MKNEKYVFFTLVHASSSLMYPTLFPNHLNRQYYSMLCWEVQKERFVLGGAEAFSISLKPALALGK